MAVAPEFYLRQVACLNYPEKWLVEAFRLSVTGNPAAVMFETAYDALWAFASWGREERQQSFEASFSLVHLTVNDVGIVFTMVNDWFVEYDAYVNAGLVNPEAPCPSASFR